jgi:hypothetical protein
LPNEGRQVASAVGVFGLGELLALGADCCCSCGVLFYNLLKELKKSRIPGKNARLTQFYTHQCLLHAAAIFVMADCQSGLSLCQSTTARTVCALQVQSCAVRP